MKLVKYFIALSFLIIIGCSESLVDSNQPQNVQNFAKHNWIALNNQNSASVESNLSASEVIKKNKGGKINLNERAGSIKIKAKLDVPKNAFSNDETLLVTVSADPYSASVNFEPSPYTFDKELSFDLEYDGLNLNGIDKSEIDFGYLAPDGSFVKAEYDKIDLHNDKLKVKNARISHFSRYGFIKDQQD